TKAVPTGIKTPSPHNASITYLVSGNYLHWFHPAPLTPVRKPAYSHPRRRQSESRFGRDMISQVAEPLRVYRITYLIDHKRDSFELLAKDLEAARLLAIGEMNKLSPAGLARILRVEEVGA